MAAAIRWLSLALLLWTGLPGPAQCQVREAGHTPAFEAARQTANWLESVAIRTPDGAARWPAAPGESDAGSHELYAGTAGVVLFLLELERVGGDPVHRELAIAGGKNLVGAVEQLTAESDAGLFTGAAGIGFALRKLAERTGDEAFAAASRNVLEHLQRTAFRGEHAGHPAVRWGPVNDVIGGSAGIGMYLLDEYAAGGDSDLLTLAIAVGDGLLSVAEPVDTVSDEAANDGGLKWPMEAGFPREMPNYSHGTAGICDFLVQLHLAAAKHRLEDPGNEADNPTHNNQPPPLPALGERGTGVSASRRAGGEGAGRGKLPDEDRFLVAAQRGANYLVGLSQQSPSGLLPHHFPDGEQLFYLGWCHGPAGTTTLFDRLVEAGGPEYASAGQRLQTGLRSCGLPARSDGFWNNVSLCCGNAGLMAFLNCQADAESRALSKALLEDLMSRATRTELPDGRQGLCWIQAEHRVRPELLQAQTGLMQGAAGIGLALLRVDEGPSAPGQMKIPGLNF